MIDWTNFTPLTACAGGVLIGTGAAILLLFNGRIAGISGITSGLIKSGLIKSELTKSISNEAYWRIAFITGLLISPVIWQIFSILPAVVIEADYLTLAVAGLIVGISTRYGAGCTSGHGVCGISRLSPRSIIATLTFMASGVLTVYSIRHLLGLSF